MEDKKFCIKCGEEIPKDSTFCPKCGQKILQGKDNISIPIPKKSPNKSSIAVALAITIIIGLVGGYYLLMPQYEWDQYNDLIDKVNFEIDEGNRILNEYNEDLNNWNSKWNKIQWESGSAYVQENNLKVLKQYHNAIDNLNPLLVEIGRHYGNAEIYYTEIKGLNLPDWTYDYIDLRIQSVQKRQQALSKETELDGKRKIGREFIIAYVDGQVDGIKCLEEINKGTINMNLYAFDSAETNLKNAQRYLRSWISDWNYAYKKIPTNSLRSNITGLECLDSSMGDILKGFSSMNSWNYDLALKYFEQGANKIPSCQSNIRTPEDVALDLSFWSEKNIEPLIDEVEKLYNESNYLEEQSDEVWENNYK